jgi:hypothetical protein
MTDSKYFEKVIITSEADLPDNEVECLYHTKVLGGIVTMWSSEARRLWKYFDWYLKPIGNG